MGVMNSRSKLLRRLYSRLTIDPSGCLLWEGNTGQDGYGRIKLGVRQAMVHRLMYELFVGPLLDGLEVDHLCRVRRCAAPAHLELVTPRENTRRSMNPAALNARKSHCDNDHEFTAENTHVSSDGRRNCRACWRARTARYKARKKAAA